MDAAAEQQLPLPADLSAVRRARGLVRRAGEAQSLPAGLVGTATLLTSELVSNAVRHAGGGAVLTLRTCAAGVRVEVSDGSEVCPRATDAPPDADHGRGLMFVDLMSSRWGVEPRTGGKVVWFEIATATGPAG